LETKSLLRIFFTTLTVIALLVVNVTHFSEVHAATTIGGIISADATWTKANSP